MADTIEHLVFLCHGVTNTPQRTYDNITNLLWHPSMPEDQTNPQNTKLGLYNIRANIDEWYQFGMSKMLNGLDVAGDRAYDEIVKVIKDTTKVYKISFIGCSLGGIIARYVVGKLLQASSKFTCDYVPKNAFLIENDRYIELNTYIALAVPNLGMARVLYTPDSWALSWIGPYFSTMKQMFVDNNTKGFMDSLFYNEFIHGLTMFKKRLVFAPTENDGILHPMICDINKSHIENHSSTLPKETLNTMNSYCSILSKMSWEVVYVKQNHKLVANIPSRCVDSFAIAKKMYSVLLKQ
jgi:hypothetical protein